MVDPSTVRQISRARDLMKIDWLGYAAMIVALICAVTLVFLLWHRMSVAAGEGTGRRGAELQRQSAMIEDTAVLAASWA